MTTKNIEREKLWRVYISSDQHKKLLEVKYDKGFRTMPQALSYVIDNQRSSDQQNEFDLLSERVETFARNNRTLNNIVGQLIGDIQFLCDRMQVLRIAFEISETELEERHEETRKILESTIIILSENLKSKPMNYFTPTKKIEDEQEPK